MVIDVTSPAAGETKEASEAEKAAGAEEPVDAGRTLDSPEPEDTEQPRRRPRFGPPAPRLVPIVMTLIMVASVAAAFFGAFAFGLSGLQEQRSQHELYASLRGLLDPASPVSPYIGGDKIPSGAPVALVNSPQAGLHDTVVVEGTSSGDLLAGPGHLANTPLPGQAGNAVILGKAATAGAPFARVTDLRAGDVISVRTGQGLFRYTVRGTLVDGGNLPTIPSTSGFLVLGTSAGSGAFASLSPDRVVYVYARLVGKAVPAPRGRPTSVPTAQLAGQSDSGAWPFFALWAAALLAATAACWWLWSTWGLLRTWIVGAPVLFAILWLLSDQALRLLPNVN